ncbi:MAG: hypothetical protein UZ22_OP11002000261 [Microgenomates bacterium OLB23]|nr:MAG: hypothetical protein UZ22_OP11002000261 [Microgenomates bacterium OLB23]
MCVVQGFLHEGIYGSQAVVSWLLRGLQRPCTSCQGAGCAFGHFFKNTLLFFTTIGMRKYGAGFKPRPSSEIYMLLMCVRCVVKTSSFFN